MTYKILYTKTYNRRAARFLKRHPELIRQYEKTLTLLELNPFHPSLRLHKLKGRLCDYQSISINISYRITIKILIHDNAIIPIDIGSHGEVY